MDDDDTRAAILLGNDLAMLRSIFEFLPLGALGQAARVCTHWRAESRPIVPRDTAHRLDTNIFTTAAQRGSPISTMDYLRAHGCPWVAGAADAAAGAGHLALVQYLREHGCPQGPSVLAAAASSGHLKVVRYILGIGGKCAGAASAAAEAARARIRVGGQLARFHPMTCAATNGHLEVLQCLHDNGWPPGNFDLEEAAAAGHIPVVRYLHTHCQAWGRDTFEAAAKAGALEMVRYLAENGCYSNPHVLDTAADGGHLETVAYLHEQQYVWRTQTVEIAAGGGHLALVEYLITRGCPWDACAATAAATAGHLPVVKYLRQVGSSGEGITMEAAMRGDLEMVQYLLLEAPGWDTWAGRPEVLEHAAYGGHTAVVELLHAHGHHLTAQTFEAATSRGHLALAEYLYEHGCPWETWALFHAVRYGDIHRDPTLAQYLHERGCPGEPRPPNRHAGPALAQYLCEHGCPWDAPTTATVLGAITPAIAMRHAMHRSTSTRPWSALTFAAAVEHTDLALVRYLHTHGHPWDSPQAFGEAAVSLQSELVELTVITAAPWPTLTNATAEFVQGLDRLLRAHHDGRP